MNRTPASPSREAAEEYSPQLALSLPKGRKPWEKSETNTKPQRGERPTLASEPGDFPHGDASSCYNTGGFDATNSANRLSFRTSANSASLYTLLKSLYPSSSAFLKYSSDRSE
jgi:hypothetical protein